jgi:hypothetical protein
MASRPTIDLRTPPEFEQPYVPTLSPEMRPEAFSRKSTSEIAEAHARQQAKEERKVRGVEWVNTTQNAAFNMIRNLKIRIDIRNYMKSHGLKSETMTETDAEKAQQAVAKQWADRRADQIIDDTINKQKIEPFEKEMMKSAAKKLRQGQTLTRDEENIYEYYKAPFERTMQEKLSSDPSGYFTVTGDIRKGIADERHVAKGRTGFTDLLVDVGGQRPTLATKAVGLAGDLAADPLLLLEAPVKGVMTIAKGGKYVEMIAKADKAGRLEQIVKKGLPVVDQIIATYAKERELFLKANKIKRIETAVQKVKFLRGLHSGTLWGQTVAPIAAKAGEAAKSVKTAAGKITPTPIANAAKSVANVAKKITSIENKAIDFVAKKAGGIVERAKELVVYDAKIKNFLNGKYGVQKAARIYNALKDTRNAIGYHAEKNYAGFRKAFADNLGADFYYLPKERQMELMDIAEQYAMDIAPKKYEAPNIKPKTAAPATVTPDKDGPTSLDSFFGKSESTFKPTETEKEIAQIKQTPVTETDLATKAKAYEQSKSFKVGEKVRNSYFPPGVTGTAEVIDVTDLDIAKIAMNQKGAYQTRAAEDQAWIRELADNWDPSTVARDPIVVYKKNGEYFLLEGNHRAKGLLTAIREGKQSDRTIPAIVLEGIPEDAAKYIAETGNRKRAALTVFDNMVSAQKRIDAGESIEKIATEMRISSKEVKDLNRMRNLDPQIVAAYRDGIINRDMIDAIAIYAERGELNPAGQVSVLDAIKKGPGNGGMANDPNILRKQMWARKHIGKRKAAADGEQGLFAGTEDVYSQEKILKYEAKRATSDRKSLRTLSAQRDGLRAIQNPSPEMQQYEHELDILIDGLEKRVDAYDYLNGKVSKSPDPETLRQLDAETAAAFPDAGAQASFESVAKRADTITAEDAAKRQAEIDAHVPGRPEWAKEKPPIEPPNHIEEPPIETASEIITPADPKHPLHDRYNALSTDERAFIDQMHTEITAARDREIAAGTATREGTLENAIPGEVAKKKNVSEDILSRIQPRADSGLVVKHRPVEYQSKAIAEQFWANLQETKAIEERWSTFAEGEQYVLDHAHDLRPFTDARFKDFPLFSTIMSPDMNNAEAIQYIDSLNVGKAMKDDLKRWRKNDKIRGILASVESNPYAINQRLTTGIPSEIYSRDLPRLGMKSVTQSDQRIALKNGYDAIRANGGKRLVYISIPGGKRPDGYVKVKSISQAGVEYWVHPELETAMNSYFEINEKNTLERVADWIMREWKAGHLTFTANTIGFGTRNLSSGISTALSMGVGADDFSVAAHIGDVASPLTGERYTADMIDETLRKYGAGGTRQLSGMYDNPKAATELIRGGKYPIFHKSKTPMIDRVKKEGLQTVGKLARSVLKPSENPVTILGMKFNEVTEQFLRRAAFSKAIREGQTAEMAADFVNKLFFNYNASTWAENKIFKRLMPFYTWTKNNVLLQLQPKMMYSSSKISRGIKNFNQGFTEPSVVENSMTDEESGNWTLKLGKAGDMIRRMPLYNYIGQAAFWGKGFDVVGGANAFIKTPFEAFANRQFYNNKQLYRGAGGVEGVIAGLKEPTSFFGVYGIPFLSSKIGKYFIQQLTPQGAMVQSIEMLNPGNVFGTPDTASKTGGIVSEYKSELPQTRIMRMVLGKPRDIQVSRALDNMFYKMQAKADIANGRMKRANDRRNANAAAGANASIFQSDFAATKKEASDAYVDIATLSAYGMIFYSRKLAEATTLRERTSVGSDAYKQATAAYDYYYEMVDKYTKKYKEAQGSYTSINGKDITQSDDMKYKYSGDPLDETEREQAHDQFDKMVGDILLQQGIIDNAESDIDTARKSEKKSKMYDSAEARSKRKERKAIFDNPQSEDEIARKVNVIDTQTNRIERRMYPDDLEPLDLQRRQK